MGGYRWKDIFTRPISENLQDHTSAFEKDDKPEEQPEEQQEDKPRTVTKYAAGVSPWGFCIGIGVFFIVGYMVAWAMHAHSNEAMVYGVFAVLFIWCLRKPMQWWAGYVAEKNKELQAQAKLDAMLKKELGIDGAMPKQPKREPTKKYAFTSDDFDEKAQAMLVPMVKQARKAKAKITGEGLIHEILKSFR